MEQAQETIVAPETATNCGLFDLCKVLNANDPDCWDSVRLYIQMHSKEDLQRELEFQGDFSRTPLHLVCEHQPPFDVVEELIRNAPSALKWKDTFGWIPLHYAVSDIILYVFNLFPFFGFLL